MGCEQPFEALKDPDKRAAWGRDCLTFLQQHDFTVITVTIDKMEFYRAHPQWNDHPYHLCMFDLLERYFYFLHKKNARGDVIAEGRSKPADELLRQAFRKFYDEGARFISADKIQNAFACKKLKVLLKSSDCIGLQIADMLARPSFLACKVWYRDEWGLSDFTRVIARILEKSKYYRSRAGQKHGFGRVWRPKCAEIKRPLSGPPKPKLVT
jgi:hypothetical protein